MAGTSITRRALLGGSVLGAAGAMLWSLRESDADADWVDAHSHAWTSNLKLFPLASGKRASDLRPESFTAEDALEIAERQGVSRIVLIQSFSYYGFDNSYLVDAARRHPGRFRIVGCVDYGEPHPDRVMRRLLPHGVTGFRVSPRVRGGASWLDGAGAAAMWRCGAETGQSICCLIKPSQLPAVDAMCARHPETPVVIDHLARVGADGEIRNEDVDALCRLSRHRQVYVKVSGFHGLGSRQAPYADLVSMIRSVHAAFGAERLMWGSDCPYQLRSGAGYRASIELVRDALDFITPEGRDWMLRKTAEKVFRFDA